MKPFHIALLLFYFSASAREYISKPEEIRIETDLTARPLFKPDTLKVLMVGDLMLHYPQISKAGRDDGSFDFSNYFKHVRHYIDDADLTIGNLESPICGKPYSGYPRFSAPEEFIIQLLDDGFDIFLCANNHIMDYKTAGVTHELNIFKTNKDKYTFSYTGISEDPKKQDLSLIVTRRGIRLAIVNFTYSTNIRPDTNFPNVNLLSDKTSLTKAFELSNEADIVIATPHWGDEYVLTHNESQKEMAEFMADNGADVIIGTHPHVVQDRESVNGVPVFYSIGNFVSNMSAANTQLGLMVSIRIIRESNGDIKLDEPTLIWTWCSRPGGFCDDYTVIPIKEYKEKKSEWNGEWDYHKMMSTFNRIATSSY